MTILISETCAKCGGDVRPSDRRALREITGWDRQREGSTERAVVFRSETGRVMCADCTTLVRYATEVGQDGLLP